jgi:hypothetical protein
METLVIANFDYFMTGEYSKGMPWFSVGESFRFILSLSYYLIPYRESYEAQFLTLHKPLGRTMRMRRDLYLGTSNYRRTANKVEQKEPSPWQ